MAYKLNLLFVCFFIINTMFSKKLKEGPYRGVLTINEETGLELPFNFNVIYKNKKPIIIIKNGDERIVVDEINIKGDSVNFKMPIFDTEFKTILIENNLVGLWINNYKTSKNKIKFKAIFGEENRFLYSNTNNNQDFEGRWETDFSPGLKDSSKAIGVFHHIEKTNYISGTFLTETGDYRYLEGMSHENKLSLSTFDGYHAYLFEAEFKNEKIIGDFYSGISYHEKWIATLNTNFKLVDAEAITFLKNKDAQLNFSFPDVNKKIITLTDKKFENKPIIIQIMGTWCPNCLDESVYFSKLYKEFNPKGLEIIALAFEKTNDFEKSRSQVLRLIKRLSIDYTILITQQTGKEKASEVLSALNKISSFPTSIFLNKQHQVVKIHTGFNGPATGNEFEIYKQRTETIIKSLLID